MQQGEKITQKLPLQLQDQSAAAKARFPCAGAKPPLPARETGRQRHAPTPASRAAENIFSPPKTRSHVP